MWSLLRPGILCISTVVFPGTTLAQSFVGGSDLDSQAPFGIPARDFADATTDPNSKASFPITGYNTSAPASNDVATGGNGLSGWTASIQVTADVGLATSQNGSVDRSKYTEATRLSIVPPASVADQFNRTGWRVCAVVFTGGLGIADTDAAQTAKLDGSCSALLPSDCVQQLQITGLAANSSRGDACEDLAVPSKCAEHFVGISGNGYNLDLGDLDAKAQDLTFLAAGTTPPTERGNKTALAEAEKKVWPVLFTWEHFSGSGQVHDSAGWMSCLKAQTTEDGATASSDGAKHDMVHKWAMGFGTAVVLLGALVSG